MSGLGKFLVITFDTGDYIQKSDVFDTLEKAQEYANECGLEENEESLYILEISKVYKPKLEPRWVEEDPEVEFLDMPVIKTSTGRK